METEQDEYEKASANLEQAKDDKEKFLTRKTIDVWLESLSFEVQPIVPDVTFGK